MLRILPDASWHAARDHPLHADQYSLLACHEPTKLSEQRSHFVDPALCHPKELRLFVFYASNGWRAGAVNPAYKRLIAVPLRVCAHARADRYGVNACSASVSWQSLFLSLLRARPLASRQTPASNLSRPTLRSQRQAAPHLRRRRAGASHQPGAKRSLSRRGGFASGTGRRPSRECRRRCRCRLGKLPS